VNCCSQIQMPERGVIDVLRFVREWDAAHPRELVPATARLPEIVTPA